MPANITFHDLMPFLCEQFLSFLYSCKTKQNHWSQLRLAISRCGIFTEKNFPSKANEWRTQGFTNNLYRNKSKARLYDE